VGGFAGLNCDHVGVARPDRHRGGQAGDDVGVSEEAVQQQRLDQQPGASAITGVLAGERPECVVRGGEGAGGAGLGERGRAGQRARLAGQNLEVVVEQQHGAALADPPGVPGDLRPPVEDDQLRSP
jgi:hypothetical protein